MLLMETAQRSKDHGFHPSRKKCAQISMNQAYTELLERQARRGTRLLPDHIEDVARKRADYERRQLLAGSFGEWVALQLGPWDWFVNPITFRDRHPDLERDPKTSLPREFRSIGTYGGVKRYVADPRLKNWQPHSRNFSAPKPPVPDRALVEIMDFLCDLQEAAGNPIKAMVAEEFGRIGGRYHCHLLVGGVAHLRRDEWRKRAFEQFGRTLINPFDPTRGAAFYASKYAAKQVGGLHLVGSFSDDYSARLIPLTPVGRCDVVRSVAIPRSRFNRAEFFPRGCLQWRKKR